MTEALTHGHVPVGGGLRIPYTVYGTGHAPRLVFAHGGFSRGGVPLTAIRRLNEGGWTVVNFDQRGHGDAFPVTDPAQCDRHRMAGDIAAIMDDLGWDTAWVGGASMGAATSLTLAFDAPQRIEGLLQIAPAIDEHGIATWVRDLLVSAAESISGGDLRAVAHQILAGMQWDDAPDTVVATMVDTYESMDAASLAITVRTATQWTIPEVPSKLHTLDMPVVILAADGDPVHPIRHAHDLATQCPRSSLRMVDLPVLTGNADLYGEVLLEELERGRTL